MNSPQIAPHSAADSSLAVSTRERIRRGVAPNTRRGYTADWRRFETWCRTAGRTPMPATPQTLATYVEHLCDAGKAPATIERAMSAVRTAHRTAGYGRRYPDNEEALAILRDHRRRRAENGQRQRKATPAVVDVIRALVDTCDTSTPAGLRDRALFVLGFATMARRSELSALQISDLRETSDGLEVLIRKSKTDRDARGVEVAVPYGTHPRTCPVRTVRAYRDALAAHGVTAGPLFRPINRHGHLSDRALSGQGINTAVRRAAAHAGLPHADTYGAHSLRAGGATAAYRHGAGVADIARQGRWNEKSPVLLGYIRAVDRWKDNPMRGIGL